MQEQDRDSRERELEQTLRQTTQQLHTCTVCRVGGIFSIFYSSYRTENVN